MQTSRRPRPLNREIVEFRDSRLIVIASEGEQTEKRYFSGLRFPKVQVEVIPSTGGRSSPQHVLDNLTTYAAEYDLGPEDELWVVIDRDRWPVQALSQVAKGCADRRFNLAVSNPSFELWLALHFPDALPRPITTPSLVEHLQQVMGGYNKSNVRGARFHAMIQDAVERARLLDTRPADRWPQTPGTRVYRIVEAIAVA